MPDVDLVGVVDVDRDHARRVALENATTDFQNHRSLFGKVDAISIAAPTPAHFAIARDFLQQDVDVFIEKPITSVLKDADELIEIAETRGCIIQVGHLERFNPAVVALADKITQPPLHRVPSPQPLSGPLYGCERGS